MMRKARASAPDYVFLGLTGALTLFGLIALSSASSVLSFERFQSSFYLLGHQFLFGLIPGFILFAVALRTPYGVWRRLAVPLLGATLLLLLLVVIPGIGSSFGGARSWFTIGQFSFQPSELAKLTFLIYLAAWFEARGADVRDTRYGLAPFLALLLAMTILVALQPDVGTMLIIAVSAVALFVAVGARWHHVGAIAAGGVALLALLIKVAPYRAARLAAFVHPELDPQGVGYHINQALLAIGSGGFFGVGFGNSRQKFRYLPEVTGDSIFAIIAEEMGFLIAAGLIALIGALLWRMFRISARAPDRFSQYLVVGIAAWFGIQSFVNIGSMLGVLPLTGLPLPFISYGGTALAVELLAVGIVGSISRHAR